MAHGGTEKYYNPANKVVNDGDTAFADDLNDINYAVDTALAQVADDLDVMDTKVTALSAEAEAWAHNDRGIPPDPLEPTEFSSKAYATESKEYAIQAGGVVIHKADGTTQLIDSAYVSATKAAASQAAALASKNAAALSETNAEAHSLQAWADQQVGFESMQDAQAAAAAADASADLAASSAANLPNATTAGASKILITNATGDGWEYVDKIGLGRKNLLINGGFDVWQRGASFSSVGTYYTADRWEFINGPGGGSVLYSPIIGPLSTSVFLKGASPTSGLVLNYTPTGNEVLRTKIENVGRFSGSTLTLSFWALDSLLRGGVAVDIRVTQNFGTGGSPSSPVVLDTFNPVSLTGTFKKCTFTFTLQPVQGKTLGSNNDSFIMIELVPVKPSSNKAVTICDVQLEFGSTATDFEYRHPAEELALCQRYYEKGSDVIPKVANMLSTTILRANAVPFKVTKRRAPDMTIGALNPSGHDGTPGAINATYPTTDEFCPQWNWTGGTAGRAVSAQFTWAADAEL